MINMRTCTNADYCICNSMVTATFWTLQWS